MQKQYNSSSNYSLKVGGTLPFLLNAVNYRINGARVVNSLKKGEVIYAGTPFEYSVANSEAKVLKVWKIKSVAANGSDKTDVVIFKNRITPVLNADTVVMVAPSTINGKGKAGAVGAVSIDAEGNYKVTLTTASFDTLAQGGLLVEAEGSGASKGMYCMPNVISCEDVVVGDNYTLLDVPRGEVHCYINVCNPMPDCVKANLKDGMYLVEEMFNENE